MPPESRSGRKIAEALGRHVDEACSVRTRQGTLAIGIGAGLGAAVGALLAGAVGAGMGGGIGAALGIATAMALAGTLSPPLTWQMALVLTREGLELYSLSWRGKPDRRLVARAYGEVESVSVEPNWLTLRVQIGLGQGEALDLEATKAGPESGSAALDSLKARVAAVRSRPDME
jgi:hypothetical protein